MSQEYDEAYADPPGDGMADRVDAATRLIAVLSTMPLKNNAAIMKHGLGILRSIEIATECRKIRRIKPKKADVHVIDGGKGKSGGSGNLPE